MALLEQNPVSPQETAQAFWKPWVTDYSFFEGIEDPMPIVLSKLEVINGLRGAAARKVAESSLERVVRDVQEKQGRNQLNQAQ